MFTTHLLIGILISILYDPSLVFIILFGSIFPDLDFMFKHRKTLHAPNIYLVSSLILLPFSPEGALFLLMSSLHCYIDLLGGSSIRPWKRDYSKSVYNHIKGEWIKTKTLVYDGSERDFLFSTFLVFFIFLFVSSFYLVFLVFLIYCLGGFYTIFRKDIPDYIDEL